MNWVMIFREHALLRQYSRLQHLYMYEISISVVYMGTQSTLVSYLVILVLKSQNITHDKSYIKPV